MDNPTIPYLISDCKYIELTQGQRAMVSARHHKALDDHRWCASWNSCTRSYYAVRSFCSREHRRLLPMHRAVMQLILDRPLVQGEQVDHINHDTLDNRSENLRIATASENRRNKRKLSPSSSQYKGVRWRVRRLVWQSYIIIDTGMLSLGSYLSEEEAARAYDRAALFFYGDFACLNFPKEKSQRLQEPFHPNQAHPHIGSTSRFRGVRKAYGGRWQAIFYGKVIGTFVLEEDAAMAYDRTVLKVRGPTAFVNFPDRHASNGQ